MLTPEMLNDSATPAVLLIGHLFDEHLTKTSPKKGAFLGQSYSTLNKLHDLLTSSNPYQQLYFKLSTEVQEVVATGLYTALYDYLVPIEEEVELDPSLQSILNNTYFIRGNYAGQNYVYDRTKDSIHEMQAKQATDLIRQLGTAYLKDYSSKTKAVSIVYQLNDRRKWRVAGSDKETYNIYQPPEWRKYTGPTVPIPDFISLYRNVFPTEEAQNLAGAWIKRGIVEREKNETILHLCGDRGTGKSILCNILANLAGKPNTGKFPRNFQRTHFDSYLKDKHLVIMEDLPIDLAVYTTLKSVCDTIQSYSIKHQNTEMVDTSYAMFIVATNSIAETYNEADNRRGLMPELGKIKAEIVLPGEELGELEVNTDPDFLYSVAQFFLTFADNDCTKRAPKTEKYRQTVWGSTRGWMHQLKNIVEKNKSSGGLPYSEAKKLVQRALRGEHKSAARWPADPHRVVERLNTYMEHGFPIARIEGNPDKESSLVLYCDEENML